MKSALPRLLCLAILLVECSASVLAQQTNPVDRQVTNPITDTPNVNPLQQEIPVRPRKAGAKGGQAAQTDVLTVNHNKQSVSGPERNRIFVYEGNVDARISVYRIQADKITVYEQTNKVIAEGNVVFDQGEQRITGSRAEWNYATKLGFFLDSTGYTNQTDDGTIIYFTADRVEKAAIDTIIATNATVTACDEQTPKWSFKAAKVTIKIGRKVYFKGAQFRVKNVPLLVLPYASVSIKQRDRESGFLTPTFSGSGNKGFRFSAAYYQTLGRSADVTVRGDIYSARGIGIGADLRTRANSRSYLNMGFYAVKDRIFGKKASAENPDQGGSSFYIEGVHYFSNGFLAAADVNITSNLAFRQIFSDSIQQAISPEERSQVFVNKNADDYSFNFFLNNQVTSLSNARIRTRQLPGISLDKRPSLVRALEKLPLYYTLETSLDGVSRKETVEDAALFAQQVGGLAVITPSIVQRLDIHPRVMLPLHFAGWSATFTAGVRGTYYSNSIDPVTRLILPRDLVRGYGEFEAELRPPAFARNFYRGNKSFFVRHVIEPYLIYRKIEMTDNGQSAIRFDYTDAIAETNEVEFGITNRFFTRRSTESVSPAAKREAGASTKVPLSSQPYEALTVTIRGKYFFDPYFGGALIPGQRNQFYPINTFSGFSYGGVPRRFSPLNIEARYRPAYALSADLRMDLDTQRGGLRATSLTFGLNRSLVQVFQSFYYTRAISLLPSLARFADARGLEPGTLRGSQWSPSVFLGKREKGLYGGVSFFFDFQKRPGRGNSSLISSTATVGYAWDCCAVTAQYFTFNVGLRHENRVVFAFTLNGIGTFGTEQIGQRGR